MYTISKICLLILPALIVWNADFSCAASLSHEDSLLAAKKHFSFAVQYKRNDDYGEALKQYRESLAYNDTVYQVHYSFAELLMLMGRKEAAKAEYLRALALNPGHRSSAGILAGLYASSGTYDSVLVMYDLMRATDRSDSLLEAVIRLREYLGKNEEALAGLRELIDRGAGGGDALSKAARLSLKTGNMKSAEEYAYKKLRVSPDDREALGILVQTARASGGSGELATRLEALTAVDSTDTASLAELAKIYRTEGKNADLARTLEHLHALDRENMETLGELAELHLALGRIESAEHYAREGIECVPGDGRPHIVMGEIWKIRGNRERAIAEYRAALADPRWKDTAGHFIERLDNGPTASEKKERDFFNRGKVEK